jgi:SAM-dependent methyltransferase
MGQVYKVFLNLAVAVVRTQNISVKWDIGAISKQIGNFSPVLGDITNFDVEDEFDAVISLFHVISYLTSNKSLLECLKRVHQQLKPNGLFLFDVWYTPAVYTLKPETRIKRIENKRLKITRIAEPEIQNRSNIVVVNFEIHILDKSNGNTNIFTEQHPMRHFSIPEIQLIAGYSGFETIYVNEFLTGNEPSDSTWGVCFLLKKISKQ